MGLFQPTTLPFGLSNACASFSRFVAEVIRGLKYVYAFLDDILIATSTEEEHVAALRVLFVRFRQYGLVINVDKCEFGQKALDFFWPQNYFR